MRLLPPLATDDDISAINGGLLLYKVYYTIAQLAERLREHEAPWPPFYNS